MRIIEETQLDFNDVLIRPARSDFKSRSEVNLFRIFERENRNTFSCIPICCANMDSISNLKTAKIFVEKGLLCAMEKHISYEELDNLYNSLSREQKNRIVITIGVNDSLDELIKFNSKHQVNIICIDVANGYLVSLKEKVIEVRKTFPNAWIIAGNVVTGDIVIDLINCGADIVKCGIGPGCFLGDMSVKTSKGFKEIKNIDIGEKVLTHTGKYEKVLNKFIFNNHPQLINISGIECTPEHKFYVADITDIDKITDFNYLNYCYWIEARKLVPTKHKLVQVLSMYTSDNKNLEKTNIHKHNFLNKIFDFFISKEKFIQKHENDVFINFIDINKTKISDNNQLTYDLEVENAYSYNINGIIVHNSMCKTRMQTGVGRPMVSMLADCTDAAHQIKGYTISDGGCTCPGDVCKALGCADFVMIGSMFAGAEEASGEIVELNGKKYKKFAGMSSAYIQNKLFGGFKSEYRTSEGRQSLIQIKGTLNDIIDDILGGIRSCATYIGCHKMKHFQKHCILYKVNRQYTNTYDNAPTFD